MDLDFDACYRAVSARDPRFDGRFFTAVTSTHIYCRPICPARTPARANVRFYRHAASAEAAGFRPCRRCRPELSPADPRWNHRQDLIGRALRLIAAGEVDGGGVAELARRLHITERHLHRLFTAELGTGPLTVARTHRLLLAKQLLTETTVPVTEIAFASGFGSVRQFNATFRQAYGYAPTELRASDRGRQKTGPLTLRLDYREPYDANTLLRFLAARAIPGVESGSPDAYTRTVPGGVVTLAPQGGYIALKAEISDVRGIARLVASCRHLLDLDADPDAISETLGGDPTIGPLVDKHPGLRVPGAFDGFELAVRAVLGQQISISAARTAGARLVRLAGSALDQPIGTLTHRFPTAAEMAAAPLAELSMPRSRVRTLEALATAVASGDIDLDGGADQGETLVRLLALPGIGPWTAGYIAMRALRDPDAYPVNDLGLRHALHGLGISDDRFESWRPWRAYATLHLWETL